MQLEEVDGGLQSPWIADLIWSRGLVISLLYFGRV